MRVKITKLPKKAYGGQLGFSLDLRRDDVFGNGKDGSSTDPELATHLPEVPEEFANVEAEKGESAVGDFDQDGQLEHTAIGGKKHSRGGTHLNVPEGTFIFSDTKKLRIKDEDILASFGKTKKKGGGYTPAQIAKQYELNKFKDMLRDVNIDPISRDTAELMIENNQKKLGQLAMVQEAMKGFPQGIPAIAEKAVAKFGGTIPKADFGWTNNPYLRNVLQRVGSANNPVNIEEMEVVDKATPRPQRQGVSMPSFDESFPKPALVGPQSIPSDALNLVSPPEPGETQYSGSNTPFGYTTPDVASMMHAMGQMGSINRYYPWMATMKAVIPKTTYADPSRELAANAELAHMQTLGAAMSGDSPRTRGLASFIQGQAAGNVANILGRYNNMNVQTANQAAAQQAEIMNNQQAFDVSRANELYKGTVITDQQYDNAKRAASDNLLKAYINAWNNRSKMSQLNDTSKYFYTDPATGKLTFRKNMRAEYFTGSAPQEEQSMEAYVKDLQNKGVPDSVINTLVRARLQQSTLKTDTKGMQSSALRYYNFDDE